jgi:protein-S-isoprenylcysteine O-methyltransferase Ste14
MIAALSWLGGGVAVTLVSALVATLVHRPLRIWPTPGAGSWQSYVFWPLFRGLNVICFATAIAAQPAGWLGLPVWLRIAAAAALALSLATFIYAFRVLGRDNSYGASEGLVTAGIYRVSRNPQNATLIAVYGLLALAADSGPAYLLCAAMMAVYALMVLAEEPWLAATYGEPYRQYCRAVPRFLAVRRAFRLASAAARSLRG